MIHPFKRLVSLLLMVALVVTFPISIEAAAYPSLPIGHSADLADALPYVDFSSDRSTWSFSVDGYGVNDYNSIFCDFFSPFDPYTKVGAYDPLVRYQLENSYRIENNTLWMSLGDLEKLYDPFFSAIYNDAENAILIRYAPYYKTEADGFGGRNTTLVYEQHDWMLDIPIGTSSLPIGASSMKIERTYTTYDPCVGGRNSGLPEVDYDTANTMTDTLTLNHSPYQDEDGIWYMPVNEIMSALGKDCFIEDDFLHIQTRNLIDVTANMDIEDRITLSDKAGVGFSDADKEALRSLQIDDPVIPLASNLWNGGWYEKDNDLLPIDYTWGGYMTDVVDGTRDRGWMWISYYLSSDGDYVDKNGDSITLTADRIAPCNIYVPHTYDTNKSKLVYMLHGGTGNENTATSRLMVREETTVKVDSMAESYDYIIVSPNGWTQNPMWREKQALASFLQASDYIMNRYPVDSDKVFLTGNSMGGKGALEVAMRYPQIFKAVAPTAAKIVDRVGNKNVVNIDPNHELGSPAYSVERDLADMPILMVHGNVDTTTSFKNQVGSPNAPSGITTHIKPYLNNATHVVVESGNHPQSYGAALPMIFDFFDCQVVEDEENYKFSTLKIPQSADNMIYLDDHPYRLSVPKALNGDNSTVMIALSDLEKLYGEDFRCYYVENYNEDPQSMRKYYTVIHGNEVINFVSTDTLNPATDAGPITRHGYTVAERSVLYRRNMERYIEDGTRMDVWANRPELDLPAQPAFSIAPYGGTGDTPVFVPAKEFLEALGLSVELVEPYKAPANHDSDDEIDTPVVTVSNPLTGGILSSMEVPSIQKVSNTITSPMTENIEQHQTTLTPTPSPLITEASESIASTIQESHNSHSSLFIIMLLSLVAFGCNCWIFVKKHKNN
ncbi:MAG: alpha/beta hydrolase-fold protein [Angelakisella sp.]|nr:alpha/beta hydrolase-fold protein [Angelakisella sp.]